MNAGSIVGALEPMYDNSVSDEILISKGDDYKEKLQRIFAAVHLRAEMSFKESFSCFL